MEMLDWKEIEESEIKEQLANVLRDKNVTEITRLSRYLPSSVLKTIRNLNEDEAYLLNAFRFSKEETTWKFISELDFAFKDEELLISMMENIDLSAVKYEEWLQEIIKNNEKLHSIILNRIGEDTYSNEYSNDVYNFLLEINSKAAIESIPSNYQYIKMYKLSEEILEKILELENAEEIIDKAIENASITYKGLDEVTLESINLCISKVSTPTLYDLKLNNFPEDLTDEDIEKLTDYGNPGVIKYTKNDDQRVRLLESILAEDDYYKEANLIELISMSGEKVTDLLYDSEYPNVRLEIAKKQNPKYSSFFLKDRSVKVKAEAAKGQIDTLIKLIKKYKDKNLMMEIAELLIPETFDALIEKQIYEVNRKIAHKCNNEQLIKIGEPNLIGRYVTGDLIYKFIDGNKRDLHFLEDNEALEKEHLRYIMSLGLDDEIYIGSDLAVLTAAELAGEGGIEFALNRTKQENTYREDEILKIKEIYDNFK